MSGCCAVRGQLHMCRAKGKVSWASFGQECWWVLKLRQFKPETMQVNWMVFGTWNSVLYCALITTRKYFSCELGLSLYEIMTRKMAGLCSFCLRWLSYQCYVTLEKAGAAFGSSHFQRHWGEATWNTVCKYEHSIPDKVPHFLLQWYESGSH